MNIIGISGHLLGDKIASHDSGVCLTKDGELVSILTEERYSRKKHDGSFPENSLEKTFKNFNLNKENIDKVYYVDHSSELNSVSYNKENIVKKLISVFPNSEINFVEHNLSHSIASFLTSGFEQASVISFEGAGSSDKLKNLHYVHRDPKLKNPKDCFRDTIVSTNFSFSNFYKNKTQIDKIYTSYQVSDFVHTYPFGDFYGMTSTQIYSILNGTAVEHINASFEEKIEFLNIAPGKIMGLAAYGDHTKIKENLIYQFIQLSPFDFPVLYVSDNGTWFNNYNKTLPVLVSRSKEDKDYVLQYNFNYYKHVAAKMQYIFEKMFLDMLEKIPKNFLLENLCLSGGCALNIYLNSLIKKTNIFKNVYINPGPGDESLCLGASLYGAWVNEEKLIIPENISFMGSEYNEQEIVSSLLNLNDCYHFKKMEDMDINEFISNCLVENKIIAWFQGRSEFGPRALGNRSILANPNFDNKDYLNQKIKFREFWRPYAGVVLKEHLHEWFDIPVEESPYMLFNSIVKPEKRNFLKSVTHVDNTCRVQSVSFKQNKKLYNLIKRFFEKTGIPVLLNTSFNILKGEPIVESPFDAVHSFNNSNLDVLVIGNFVITKKEFSISS